MNPEVDLELENKLRPLDYKPSLKSFENQKFSISMKSEDIAKKEIRSYGGPINDILLSNNHPNFPLGFQSEGK